MKSRERERDLVTPYIQSVGVYEVDRLWEPTVVMLVLLVEV